MSKLCWRVTPVNGYDIPALERWLEEMAGEGLIFFMTTGPLTAFQREAPASLRIHLEPAQGSVAEEPPEQADLYAQAGWRYLGPFRGSYFVYAADDREAQAYTDPESMDWALGRFFRQKLLGGLGLLVVNVLLFALYYNNIVGLAFTYLRDGYPVTAFAHYPLAALLLTVLGLALVDLSWLLGLGRLRRFRRSIAAGQAPEPGRRGGWLLAAGVVVLLPVIINTCQLFLDLDYRPYGIELTNFLTIEEIEGEGFRATGDSMYNMDYVSHGGTLLEAEYWYWRQYGAFAHYDSGASLNTVPVVQYSIRRFPLTALAQAYWEEQGRIGWYGYDPVEGLVPDAAFDAVSAKRGENGRGVPQTTLVLRRGRTVMRVEYRGEKDLLEFQEELAAMMTALE